MKTETAVPTPTPVRALRCPPLAHARLKAERVQEPALSRRVQERLKAERVQERLKAMPGWKLAPGGKSIDRARVFPDPGVAAAYAAYVSAHAASKQQLVGIALASGQVLLTLHAPNSHGRPGALTDNVLDFAASLG